MGAQIIGRLLRHQPRPHRSPAPHRKRRIKPKGGRPAFSIIPAQAGIQRRGEGPHTTEANTCLSKSTAQTSS